jgi:hypothetical protein
MGPRCVLDRWKRLLTSLGLVALSMMLVRTGCKGDVRGLVLGSWSREGQEQTSAGEAVFFVVIFRHDSSRALPMTHPKWSFSAISETVPFPFMLLPRALLTRRK